MPLPDAIKVKIRDHLKYGVAGMYRVSPAGGTTATGSNGYRFFQAYGQLEYRMNNLSANEEAMVTGDAVGSVGFNGLDPVVGNVFTVNISGGGLSTPVTITVTASEGDKPYHLAAKVALAINGNTTLQAARFYAIALFGTGPFSQGTEIPLPECNILAKEEFTITASAAGSPTAVFITAQGDRIAYDASLDGRTTLFGFIPILDALKGAVASASQNFDTKRADVWYGRSSEMALRIAAYEQWRVQFGDFMGLVLNPSRPNRGARSGYVRHL